jgi:hypothetical protein
MALKPIDQVFNRWLLDREFRTLMNENPEQALASYDLTDTEWKKLSRLSRKVRRQAKANQVPVKAISKTSFLPRAVTHNWMPGSGISFSRN